MDAPEWVVTQFAAGRIGAVLVNINPAYRLIELEQALKMADVATLVVGCPFKDANFVQMVETIAPELATGGSCRPVARLQWRHRDRRPSGAGLAGLVRHRVRPDRPGTGRFANPQIGRSTSTTSSSRRGRPDCPRGRC